MGKFEYESFVSGSAAKRSVRVFRAINSIIDFEKTVRSCIRTGQLIANLASLQIDLSKEGPALRRALLSDYVFYFRCRFKVELK